MTRSVDDFHEFFEFSYRDVLAAFEAADLSATIEAGSVGHYLLVARAAEALVPVEVTSEAKPLPDDPADVSVWVLSVASEQVMVPAEAGVGALVAAVSGLLDQS